MRLFGRIALISVLGCAATQTLAAQEKARWADRWIWGAQAGLFVFKTNTGDFDFTPDRVNMVGGHWLITAQRTALYISFEQTADIVRASVRDSVLFLDLTSPTGLRKVFFDDIRRFSVALLVMPTSGFLQPYVGGGFTIMQVLDPEAELLPNDDLTTFRNAQTAAEDFESQAFFLVMGGLNIRLGPLSVFGQYLVTTEAAEFLLDGSTHTFQGGVRFSIAAATEGVTGKF